MDWTRVVDEIKADFTAGMDQAASERSSELNLVDVFIQEFGRLKRIVAGMGLSALDGEDVLQDVSIQVLNRPGKYQTAGKALQWLIKVTINRCLTEHRRRKRFHRTACEILKRRSEAEQSSPSSDEKIIAAEELEVVREILQQLDDSLLTPMVLRYFCDLNSKEVSQILALNHSTVRSRLREGRMVLAKRLVERGVER